MNEGIEAQPADRGAARILRWLAPALVVLATLLVFLEIRGYGLMGYDSYPLILTARIESFGDFIGSFTEKMMDGRYHGDYFRPLLNLSFAADERLFGLEPWGYQLTGALLFGGAGLAIWLLAGRLTGKPAGWGALVALLFFLVHDSHFEVVPVPARRPELLCALFACIALWTQILPRQLEKRWPILPAVFMVAAAAAKETGYVLPAVALLAVFCYSRETGAAARLRHVLRATLPHAVLLGILFALRLASLGGLGGPAPLPPGFQGPGPLELSKTLFERLLLPQTFSDLGSGLLALALVAIALLVLLALRGFLRRSASSQQALPEFAARGVLVALSWILIVGLLYGISRSIEQWYLFLPVVGLSLLLGAGTEVLLVAWRREHPAFKSLAALVGLMLLVFAYFQGRYSPLWHSYPEWRLATEASDEFFEKLGQRMAASEPGQPIKAPPLPMWYPPAQEGPAVRGAAILDVYSVQAWAELRFPERKWRAINRPPLTPMEPGETAIQLIRPKQF